jgi:hypothetical protein
MPVIQVEAQLSVAELLEAVEQLSTPELEEFVTKVIALQARRRAPSLSKTETELLLTINQGLTTDLQKRYDELIAKRQDENISPEEFTELVSLTDQLEAQAVKRAEALSELARLRQTSLPALTQSLVIPSLSNSRR